MQRIPFYKFQVNSDSWCKHTWFHYDYQDYTLPDGHPIHPSHNDDNNNKKKKKKRQLTILTFNILFDIYKAQDTISHSVKRYKYQLEEFKKLNLDIICLQEVTATFLALMEADEWIRETYYVSHCISDKSCAVRIMPYGNIILSKYPFSGLYQFTYPSLRDKSCTVASFYQPNSSNILTVVSCHLKANDSYDWSHLRRKQLNDLVNHLEKYSPFSYEGNQVFIFGDFNFQCEEEENISHLLSCRTLYADMWPLVNPTKPGITFNSHVNTLIPEIFPCAPPCLKRFDRGLMKINNDGSSWQLLEASLEFDKPMNDSKRDDNPCTVPSFLFPSDHFAIKFTLQGPSIFVP